MANKKANFLCSGTTSCVVVAHLTFLDVVFSAVNRESDSNCGEAKTASCLAKGLLHAVVIYHYATRHNSKLMPSDKDIKVKEPNHAGVSDITPGWII